MWYTVREVRDGWTRVGAGGATGGARLQRMAHFHRGLDTAVPALVGRDEADVGGVERKQTQGGCVGWPTQVVVERHLCP